MSRHEALRDTESTELTIYVSMADSVKFSGALRHVQSILQLLCVKRRDYGNVSLVRGSYLVDFDVRQLFVRWFL